MALIKENCNISVSDDFSTSSIMEFLKKEQECYQLENNIKCDTTDLDVESIFEEIQRLSGVSSEPSRDIDEILVEAEILLKKDLMNADTKQLQHFKPKHVETQLKNISFTTTSSLLPTKLDEILKFERVVNAVEPDSIISNESTPHFSNNDDDHVSDEIDTVNAITVGVGRNQWSCDEQNDEQNQIYINAYTNCGNDKLLNSEGSLNIPNAQLINNTKGMKQKNIKKLSNENDEIFLKTMKTQVSSNMSQNYCNKVNCSENLNQTSKFIYVERSPIENLLSSRENSLKLQFDQLQEKLKNTEERLQSLKIQHNSLSEIHRDLKKSNYNLQENSELLKLDVQHLNECANVLRIELQTARNDRTEALDIQKQLQDELNEVQIEKKRTIEKNDKDAKLIQDLQRQCKEMEKILLRKHPDSVSALIVASKNPFESKDDSSTRRLLEQRIAQLEADAKDQDVKSQKILQNVQAKFNSVQAKYEHHIADLETQVLSLQQINTKLNEKIEFQIITLNNFTKSQQQNCTSSCSQTDDFPDREFINLRSNSTQTDTARSNSSNNTNKVLKKSQAKITKTEAAKEDAHLLATIRGMRIDLAIKDKAVQRLTRELEECKKTIKKLQKEKDYLKHDKASSSSSASRKPYDPLQYSDQQQNNNSNNNIKNNNNNSNNNNNNNKNDGNNLKEALNKIKLLEFDYKSLHDKRLQDLKTLQAAHERELLSCQETVRILEQKLTERDEAFANQKCRKVPIDYYSLKAKVTVLERRHSEREQRLHMLVEALSKGRINGALEELLNDTN